MIWSTIALWVVSFLVTALLAPKPEFENARADDLDPNSFPQASENSPVPLVLGRARVNGPNTLYYGGFRAVPIKEKVKTGLFSSTTVVKGYKYYLTVDMGICLGPQVWLKDIYVDEEAIEAGIETNSIADFEFYEEEFAGFTTWSGNTFLSQTGDILFSEAASSVAVTSGRGFTEFDLVDDFGLTAINIDGGGLAYTQRLGYNFATTIGGADFLDLYTRVHFLDADGLLVYGSEGVSAHTGNTKQFGVGNGFATLNVTIPPGARTVEVTAWYTTLFPAFNSSAFGSHKITIVGDSVTYNSTNWDIYEPELFGGDDNGGGLIGNYTFYPGQFDQVVDGDVELLVGVDNVPAYRGISHAVFNDLYIGESPTMRKMAFDVCVYTTSAAGYMTDADNAKIGDDINPAEALFEILTSEWRGLNIPTSLIDTASFGDVADTLAGESLGISVIVSGAQNGKKVVSEILRTIDGIMYQDPTTGKFVLKLIRDDYTAGDLTLYDEGDIINVRSLSKTAWEDVVSEVKVSFASREKEDGKIALAQDMAVANMLGRRRTTTVSYPFVYDPNVANNIAARELSQLSVPLLKFQLEMTRTAYAIKPGDVFKVTWPEYGLSEVIVRASTYDTGELLNNKIVIECTEDKFGIGGALFAAPADSAWTDPVPLPNDIVESLVVEMPYFLSSRLDYPVADGYGGIIPFPVNPDSTESTSFTMYAGNVSGTLDAKEPQIQDYPVTGVLSAELDYLSGFETGVYAAGITITGTIGTPLAATSAEIASGESGLLYIDGEWLAYEGVTDNGSGSFTLDNVHRGLLGTRPKTHAASTRVYRFEPNLLGTGVLGAVLLENGTAYYKLLDIAGDISQDITAVTESSLTLGDIADRPLRPRDLEIDSNARAEVPYDATADLTFTVSWSPSNRAATVIPDETDAAETPDQTEEYDVEVWIDGVDETATYGATSVAGTSQAIDLTGASGSQGEIRVLSRRTGGDTKESVHYAAYPFTLSQATMDSTTVTMDSSTTTMDQTS